jgi:hypothetical protein
VEIIARRKELKTYSIKFEVGDKGRVIKTDADIPRICEGMQLIQDLLPTIGEVDKVDSLIRLLIKDGKKAEGISNKLSVNRNSVDIHLNAKPTLIDCLCNVVDDKLGGKQ